MILETRLAGWEYEGREARYAAIQAGTVPAPRNMTLRESAKWDGIEVFGEDGFSYGWIPAKLNRQLGTSPLKYVRPLFREDVPRGYVYRTAYAKFDRFDMIGATLTTTMMVRVYAT